MATPYKIYLTVEDTGIVKHKPQDTDTAAKVSELLQENHEKYHIFFDGVRRHNHIVHHLLTLYGLGASSEVIEKQYHENESIQHPIGELDEKAITDMSNPETFQSYLAKGQHYRNFLVFWQREIEAKGRENVLNENLFARTERADDLLIRMFSGYLHPLIHLGFGIEFKQPVIIAEALASAAVHEAWPAALLLGAEKAANTSTKTLLELLEEIRADTKLFTAVQPSQTNKLREGIYPNAMNEMINYASQWTVPYELLQRKTAEMINTVIYFTSAAQNPPKQIVFDFYFIHCVNCSIFFSTFNTQTWLSTHNKCRLLEWKARFDLAMYAAQHSPSLLLEEVSMYVPNKLEAGDGEWKGIFQRLFEFPEDGHGIKLARAVASGEKVCKEFEGEEWAKIKGLMWEKIGNMVVDGAEDTGANWARSVGFEETWEPFEDRPRRVEL